MTELHPRAGIATPSAALKASAVTWFLIAAVGQILFAAYLVAGYALPPLMGTGITHSAARSIDGYVVGDWTGNLVFASHVLLATVVSVGGLMQLTPPLRRRFPALHRWIGRTYMLVSVILAVGGVWLVWGRGSRFDDIAATGVTLNAVAILIFAAIALRFAIARDIDTHRRWAMRLFMVVSGVWFQRLGYMGWVLANGGPRFMSDQMNGPFDVAIPFLSWLIPLAFLELYFWANRSSSPSLKLSTSIVILAASGATALGVAGAYLMMWSPVLRG